MKKSITLEGTGFSVTKIRLVLSFLWLLLLLVPLQSIAEISASREKEMGTASFLQGQTKTVTGNVSDQSGEPVPFATVAVKGTTIGVTTDMDGNFSLSGVPEDATLVVTFVGMKKEEANVTGLNHLTIVLQYEILGLDEVVVVGYGTQRKETVTGALSSISSDELVEQPVSNVSQALGGRLPGLISNQAGGRPGKDASTIKIRGIGTLDAGPGSDPLILIDGVERDMTALNFLDPNEIESLSILKDASSTAVFGVRGANGVILVTTKRGQLGPAKINYKSSMAVLVPTNQISFIDSYQQTGLLNEFSGFAANTSDPSAPYPQHIRDRFKGVIDGNPMNPTDPFFYPSTDYADLMFNDYATQQQHNFTIRGGTEKLKYFASLGYFDQGGLFKELNPGLDQSTSYKRYNYRTNIDVALTETTIGRINIGGSFNRNTSLGQPNTEPARAFYWSAQQHSSPWQGYIHDGKVVMLEENANSVLLNNDFRGYNVELENTADYTFIIDQKLNFITEGLSAKGTVSLTSYFQNYIQRAKNPNRIPYWEPYLEEDGTVTLYQAKENILPFNSVSQGKSRKEYYEFAINYDRTFGGDHAVTALFLGNADKSHFSQNTFNSIPRSYLGLVGRTTYNFRNRYMAEFNLGYNGSENFDEGKRFGLFPAYSAGWTFTEEPWLKNILNENILSYGKFRFSYGTVGNDKMRVGGQDIRFLYLPDSYSMNAPGLSNWYNFPLLFGQPGSTNRHWISVPGVAGNPNVTWEKSVKINYGADLAFFRDLFSLKFDYFKEDRTDILINQRVVPVYQQTGTLALNLGRVKNEGYEIELGFNERINTNTRIWVNLNYTHSRNRIIEVDEPTQPYDYQAQTGRRVGEFWGYQQEGFFMTAEEANAYKEELWQVYKEQNPDATFETYQAYQVFSGGSDVSAGDLRIIDRNGDGIIDEMDQGYLGTTRFPETMFGLRAGITHKGWSFSLMLQGASDFSVNKRTNIRPLPERGSILDFVMKRYTPERYEADAEIEFPRLLATNNNWALDGSYWYQDATYLRLKNVEISYTFDSSRQLINQLGIDNIRVYTNGMDLLTFSGIKHVDPEATNGQLRYPRSRVINLGIQVQF